LKIKYDEVWHEENIFLEAALLTLVCSMDMHNMTLARPMEGDA
jgi:hypothetical protein